MNSRPQLRHHFVEFIPAVVDEGVIYVSIAYATAVHKCCCGCGREVVTPFSPTDLSLLFDGETVSLNPSIGNWSFSCKSHYWIQNNLVTWAPRWTDDDIEVGRRDNARLKARYHKNASAVPNEAASILPRARSNRILRTLHALAELIRGALPRI